MPTTVNIHEAKTHLSSLLERVRRGEDVIIAKAGEPIATLSAYRSPKIVIGDLVHLDRSVSDEEWAESDRAIAALFEASLDQPPEPDSC